ncbi:uncharacterized protein [Montipora foliosa]|uniref:uncharacterized protein n=1 Tax=Montipora foliosa TaxID=591990 RepID=UPI0035F13657
MISFLRNSLRSRTNGAERDYHRVDFNIHTPTYKVKYLGCEMLFSPGASEICDTVKAIFSSKKEELKSMDHYSLKMTKQELSLRDRDSTEDEEKVFQLRRIRFSGVFKAQQRLFFFTYQPGTKSESVECNVVLCKSNSEAKSLAKVISRAFMDARSELHHQEVENRKRHVEGLSGNSFSRLDVDVISNVDANRLYYNMSAFKNSRSSSAASAVSSNFHPKNRTRERLKQSNQSCHLDESVEWERTESSLDTRQSDVEKTSTSGETLACTCENECILEEIDTPEKQPKEVVEKILKEPSMAAVSNETLEMDLVACSPLLKEQQLDIENECTGDRNCDANRDWSKVSILQETEI